MSTQLRPSIRVATNYIVDTLFRVHVIVLRCFIKYECLDKKKEPKAHATLVTLEALTDLPKDIFYNLADTEMPGICKAS